MIDSAHFSPRFLSSSCSQNPIKTPSLPNLLKLGFSLSSRSLSRFLSFLLKSQKAHLVLDLFSQISSNFVEVNSRTHSLVAGALLKSRSLEEAKQFIAQSGRFDFDSKKGILNSLIRRICVLEENPDVAFSLLIECVRDYGISPSFTTFRAVVLKFRSQGKMERAKEVLDFMESGKFGYPFDNFACSSIISGFTRTGKAELGLEFYEKAEKTPGFQPNLVTCTAVVDALCREGRIDEACDFVREMDKNGLALDEVLYSSWISGYFKKGIPMEGLQKHRLMVENGILPDVVSYTTLIDGLCKDGNVEKAIGFLNEMEKYGLKPNLISHTVLIQGFCRRGKLKEAFCVLRKMEELGIDYDEFVFSILIDGLCKDGDLGGVFSLLGEMEKKGIKAGSVTYNTMINGLCKIGDTKKADEMSRDYIGDNFTFSTLLHGYMREMDVEGVQETVRRLEEAGIVIDIVTFNVLIKAIFMVGMAEDACMIFQDMPKKGVVANSVTYCTMVDGFCKLGMINKALEVFEEYRRTSPVADVSCHEFIIRGLCKENMVEMAIEVFEDLCEKSRILGSFTYRKLIKTLFRRDKEEGVLKLVQRIEKLEPELLSSICNDIIVFLCRKGCFVAALDAYIFMRRRSLSITSKSYYILHKSLIRRSNRLIIELLMCDYIKVSGIFEQRIRNILTVYLCKSNVDEAIKFVAGTNKKYMSLSALTTLVDALKKEGRAQDAYKFLMEADGNEVAVDAVVYSIAVDGLCKEGYLEKALDLCATMRNKGINLNSVIYNSVINGLCNQGCLVEALRLFDSMELNGVLPTVITYAALIGALSREGFLQDANQLFERMVLKGITSNTRIYNLLIYGYSSFGLIEEALKFLLDLKEDCLQPDAFTISSLINGYCLKGDIEGALGFFNEYKGRGFSPDFLGFMNLIKGLFTKGRMEEARSILRDMIRCTDVADLINRAGNELHVESLVDLLNIACEQGRIQEVIHVLREVGYVVFPSWRSNNSVLTQLKGLHETVPLATTTEEKVLGKGGTYPLGLEVPRNKSHYGAAYVADMNHGWCKVGKEDGSVKDYEYLFGKSLSFDFDTYYTIIASLCSKGHLQKANNVVKAMLLNSGGNC